MDFIMHPRRCGKTQSIAEIKKLNEVILNTMATTSPSPVDWSAKTGEEILRDINSFVEQMHQEDDGSQPPWSAVRIKDKKEVERLINVRQGIQATYNYPHFVGEVIFLGYKEKPEGKFDVFYLPFLKTILHISLKPVGVENVIIDGTFKM